jgi:hypothetical protein
MSMPEQAPVEKAVAISLEDPESLEETLDVMDSAPLLNDIRVSLAELGSTEVPRLSREEAQRLIADHRAT